jgi:hypothetical protein
LSAFSWRKAYQLESMKHNVKISRHLKEGGHTDGAKHNAKQWSSCGHPIWRKQDAKQSNQVGTQLGYATAVALPSPPPTRFCAQNKHTWQLDNHYAISKHGSLLISLTKTKSKFKQQAIPSYFSHTNLKQQAKFLSSP